MLCWTHSFKRYHIPTEAGLILAWLLGIFLYKNAKKIRFQLHTSTLQSLKSGYISLEWTPCSDCYRYLPGSVHYVISQFNSLKIWPLFYLSQVSADPTDVNGSHKAAETPRLYRIWFHGREDTLISLLYHSTFEKLSKKMTRFNTYILGWKKN